MKQLLLSNKARVSVEFCCSRGALSWIPEEDKIDFGSDIGQMTESTQPTQSRLRGICVTVSQNPVETPDLPTTTVGGKRLSNMVSGRPADMSAERELNLTLAWKNIHLIELSAMQKKNTKSGFER